VGAQFVHLAQRGEDRDDDDDEPGYSPQTPQSAHDEDVETEVRERNAAQHSRPTALEQLADLRDRGVITAAEFETKKAQLLERM